MLNINGMMARYVSFFSRVACVSLLLPLLAGCLYDIYVPQNRSAKAIRTPAAVPTSSGAPSAAPSAPQPVVVADNFTPDYRNLSYHFVTVERGSSLSQVAELAHVPMQAIIAMNNLAAPFVIYPGQQLKVPTLQRHDVRPGETLYAISRAYDRSVAEIAYFNGLAAPYRLLPGMEIRVPQAMQSEVLVASADMSAWPAPSERGSVPVKTVTINSKAEQVTLPPSETRTVASRAPISSGPLSAPLPAPSASAPVAAPPAPTVKAPVTVAAPAPTAPPAPEPSYQTAKLDLPPVPTRQYTTKAPPARSGKAFAWPVKGQVISGFGKKETGFHNDGVNIAVKEGTPIRAAENGVVSYVGNEMRSFGNLLLISHADGYVTAYGHTQKIVVAKGDAVKKGDIVAYAGSSGNVTQSQLHFEIRKKGQAIDPVAMLD